MLRCFFHLLVVAILLSLSAPLLSQVIDSATTSTLPEVYVGASPLDRVHTTPLSLVNSRTLQRFAAADFTPGMNRIPGVRFEQRTPGSYRISIRNTARRSPFGVRDVQVYWNDIPLTEPGGDTPLNFIDLTNVDAVNITKGPNQLRSGSPLGGTVEFSTKADAPNQVGGQYGSFNSKAAHGRFTLRDSLSERVQVRVAHRSTDGHRDWSNFRRTTAQVSFYDQFDKNSSFYSGWNIRTESHLLATRLDYNLPGALTPAQFAEAPFGARPGSAETFAAIDYENILAGTTIKASNKLWSINGTAYLTGFRFDNPFNVNHKRETNVGFGGRLLVRRSNIIGSRSSISVGGELQEQFRDARQYDPNEGTPGDLQFSDDINSERFVGFAALTKSFQTSLGEFTFDGGLSLQQVRYRVDRSFERGADPSLVSADFGTFVAPRASLNRMFEKGSLTFSVARGSSNPTLREFRTNEGSLNRQLRPEEGTTVELFGDWQITSSLNLSANAYLTQLSQTITTFQDSSGIQLFRNTGSTRQPGIELAVDWQLTKAINISPAYTYQPYSYRDYELDGTSFAGRPMPGLPTHTADVLIHSAFAKTCYADFNIRYESENPLDDAGDVVADAFVLLRLQVGAHYKNFHAFIAGDNLLDAVYSLGNDINPQFGNRYFQAAPPRNFNVGASYTFGQSSKSGS